MMGKLLKVIDFNCGIGGRTEGFLRAGYEVVMATETDAEKAEIYNHSHNMSAVQYELEEDNYVELPEVDVFAGQIRSKTFNISGQENEKYNRDVDTNTSVIMKAIRVKRPKACLFVCGSATKSKYVPNFFEYFTEQLGMLDYKAYIQRLSSGDYTELPLKETKIYVIAIRCDVSRSEFLFPLGRHKEKNTLDFNRFFEKNVDPWYSKVNYNNFTDIKRNTLYKSLFGKYGETKEIDTGMMSTMYVAFREGLRRFTHNEMAKCKGMTDYNYNNCLNKRNMYGYISEASNAYVIEVLAKQLKKVLQEEDAETWQELTSANDIVTARLSGFEYENEKESEDDEIHLLPYRAEDIRIDQKMISLYQIYRWMTQKTLDLSPEFQRNFVWDIHKKSLLIESLMLNIPIPAFYFDENEDGMKSVIDGVQRLSTIYSFLKNEFKLKGLQYLTNCNRLTFSELEKNIKRELKIHNLQLIFWMPDVRIR